jgi:4-amino-4-deoxy-L-arabinose transferase-like glycosyltransferase
MRTPPMPGSSRAGIITPDQLAGLGLHSAIDKRSSSRRYASLIAAFAIALVILSRGITAPFEKDVESQSAQWVVDIVQHGHWLLPHDYYDLVERKPPLFYWLGAVGVKLSGGTVDEARARMPSLIAGAAVAALVMDWAAADLGAAGGWLAFFFLLGMYGFAARATVALTDVLMTFFLMATWRLIRPQLDGADSFPRTAAAGLILGLGVLVKGPVIVVLIAVGCVLYLATGRVNPLRLVARQWPWVMILIAVAVASAWYVPAFIAGRTDAWGGVFVDENFGHFLPAKMGGTGEAARPIYYIVVRLLGGMLPLSFLLPALALGVWAFSPAVRPALRYQAAIAFAVVVLFSASSAKRDDYILPAIPPFAILFAALFSDALTPSRIAGTSSRLAVATASAMPADSVEPEEIASETSRARWAAIARGVRDFTVAAIATVMLVGVAATMVYVRISDRSNALGPHLQSSDASFATIFLTGMRHLPPAFVAFITAVAIGAIVIVSALMRRSSLRTGTGLAILCLAGSTLWTGTLKPQELETRSLRPFAKEVRTRVGSAPLYVAFMDPEFAWYYGAGVPAMPRPLAQAGPAYGTSVYLVSRPNELVRFPPAVRHALILVLPSSVLGGNPPSLYLLGSLKTAQSPPPVAADSHRQPNIGTAPAHH